MTYTFDCGNCGTTFTASRKDAKWCNPACGTANWRKHNTVDWKAYNSGRSDYLQAYRENRREEDRAYARKWSSENPEAVREYSRRRRALRRGTTVEYFTEDEIFERDGWICSWCHNPVDKSLKHPDPMSKSLDHTEPLSRGGSHTRDNVTLMHLVCNLVKHY